MQRQKRIDPHVHCRDGKEAHKTTIKEVAELARTQGIDIIFDMPNTDPPILTEKDVRDRLKLAAGAGVKYFLYVGLTAGETQIKKAVDLAKNHPQVVGLKLYTTYRTGPLNVSRETSQKMVYLKLKEAGYKGVLAVHCEKEKRFKSGIWDSQKPWTHSLVRPPGAEVESVNDQIKFAKEAGFAGKLHICHISCPESVDLVQNAKNRLNISCGVTPHHLSLTTEDQKIAPKFGLYYKVNPPLRDKKMVELLLKYLKDGKIDVVETDHAPHAAHEKSRPPYLSGMPSLNLYSHFLDQLRQEGVNETQIDNLTYWNIKRIFGDKLKEV